MCISGGLAIGNIVGRINEVTLCQAELLLRWVAFREYTVLLFNQVTQVNSAFHPSEVGKRVAACMTGVVAGRIHLCWVAGVILYGR